MAAAPPDASLQCDSQFVSASTIDSSADSSQAARTPTAALRRFVQFAVPGLRREQVPDEMPPESRSGFSFKREAAAGHAVYSRDGAPKALFNLRYDGNNWFVASHAMCPELELEQ